MPRLLEANLRHAQYFKMVVGKAHALFLRGGDGLAVGLDMFDLDLPNVVSALAWVCLDSSTADRRFAHLRIEFALDASELIRMRLHPRELIPFLNSAVLATRLMEDRTSEVNALVRLGESHRDLDKGAQAIRYYEDGLRISAETGNQNSTATCLLGLGDAHRVQDQYNKAREYYERALAIFAHEGNRRYEADCLRGLAETCRFTDEYDRARQYLEQALSIAQEIGNRRGEADAIWDLAGIERQLALYPQSQRHY